MYPSGYRANVRGRIAIVLLLVALPAVATAAARPTIAGTNRADVLLGSDASDRIDARAGNDRIAVEYDGGRDDVSCGPGRDIVTADLRDRVRPDCEVVGHRIHRDRHTNPESQHESEVEPDSLTVGATTVTLFQVGRRREGGAASIGFSTSRDSGRTWRGDPARADGGLEAGRNGRPRQRSGARVRRRARRLAGEHARARDGGDAADDPSLDERDHVDRADRRNRRALGQLAYDKNWLTCDNGPASPFRGRCYLAYTLLGRDPQLAVQRSDDGGRTWSPAVTQQLPVTGVLPSCRPTGSSCSRSGPAAPAWSR